MKNMKYRITFGIALMCVILFTACDNIVDTPVNDYGKISISLAVGEAAPQMERTLLPLTVFDKYVYTFTKTGETTGVVLNPDDDGFFTLEVGSYTVEVQAFIGNAEPYTLAASGVSSSFSVGSGSNNPIQVRLSIAANGGPGEFTYTITYPAGADEEVTLQKWPELDDITLSPVNSSQGNGITETLELDAGTYLFTVLINKNGLYAGTSEAVHIYSSLPTVYTKDFNNEDLLKGAGATVEAPTLNTRTYNSITINAVTAPDNGQYAEYGISTSNNAAFAVWQSSLTFSGLTSGTTYYIFARSAQNTYYNAGTASNLTVKTSPHSIVLYPRGQLNTYINVPNNEKIQFRAVALRDDGTVIENASGFAYSDANVNTSTGVFTPQTAGDMTITVSLDGTTSSSSTVTVHPADYMRQPYYYPGTGKTYQGFTGTTGTRTTSGGVTVTYPSEPTFSADGFFTLEGYVNNSAVYNYAYVQLTKDGDSNLITYYLVRDNFKQRIWLRFGPGSYRVSVHGFSSITLASQLGAEGDYLDWSVYSSSLIFDVTNTRNDDSSVDSTIPDKRFIYPSSVVQSDDFRITNLAADLTYGITDNTAKIKAIHDYIVTNTVYDYDSYSDGGTDYSRRKKQDALTVLGRRYTIDSQYNSIGGHFLAVCEGYTNTFAALARAVGIEVKYVSGSVTSSDSAHAWNHVYVNGGWKFIDVTWDDPTPDRGPYYVRDTYYLLTSLYGVNNDHYGYSVDVGRAAIGSVIPRQRGVPDGWY